MTSHDTFTSGIPRVLTVASLQRLKMEALNPGTVNFEERSVMEVLNAQNKARRSKFVTLLVFGEFRVQIPVLTKLTGVLFVLSLSHQGKCCVGFTLPQYIQPLFIKVTNIHHHQCFLPKVRTFTSSAGT